MVGNQRLVQAIAAGFSICVGSSPTRYERDASSIGLVRSIRYGLGVLHTTATFVLWRAGLASPDFLDLEAPRHRLARE